jgi:hypothetical protein
MWLGEVVSPATQVETEMTLHVHSAVGDGHPSGVSRSNSLLNERQASELLNVKVATLRRWRWAGKGPAFLKIGGAVRYDPAELDRFVASARRSSTSDQGTGFAGREAA